MASKKSSPSSKLLKGALTLAETGPIKELISTGVKTAGSAVKELLSQDDEENQQESDKRKTVNIVEQIDIGVPRSVAYNQWTQFEEFGRFTKGVEEVDQKDEAMLRWRVKIAFSTRAWKSQITEQVPDQRIAWTSSGDKGTVDGVVTFHEITPDLTRVLLDLEYHPSGFVEKLGNLWRAQGRRARLDLKKFRVFVMSRGEETGSWRGEIDPRHGVEGSRRRRSQPDESRGNGRAQKSQNRSSRARSQTTASSSRRRAS